MWWAKASNQDNKRDNSAAPTLVAAKGNSVCENCVQSQKAAAFPSSSNNEMCGESYVAVDRCMKQNAGQISSCVGEWKAFQLCHNNNNNDNNATADHNDNNEIPPISPTHPTRR
jgi:hypothetical protein